MLEYPFSVYCIMAAEFCERFAFCGLRTILSLYLRNVLHYSENASTVLYHMFIMSCYIVPLMSAIMADSFFGNYKTIVFFMVIYLGGGIFMWASAVPMMASWSIILPTTGLALIALGTGGMKPCIAAFGAEQFRLPDQKDMLSNFFSFFYSTINLGGFLGMVIIPLVKKSFPCYGQDTCYSLGFGLPMLLLALTLVFFTMGRKHYTMKTPKRNVILQFIRCSSASHMDGNFFGMVIVPDQLQVINSALVFLLIPGFNQIFYPWLTKIRVIENSLQRMSIGGIAAGLAFFTAGVLEIVLEKTYPQFPGKQHAFLNIINTLPCDVHVLNRFDGEQIVASGEIHLFKNIACDQYQSYVLIIRAPVQCGYFRLKKSHLSLQMKCIEFQIDTVLIDVYSKQELQTHIIEKEDFAKSLSGASRLRIAYSKDLSLFRNVTVTLSNNFGEEYVYFVPDIKSNIAVSAYMEITQGIYLCTVGYAENPNWYEEHLHLAFGGVYDLVFREDQYGIAFMELYTMSVPNTISMLWQIPQYVLISVAEIMFGIAGLEFSFSQAPNTLKTVTIAAWYLAVAIGNFLVILITQLEMFKSQAYNFFLFALLIVLDMVVFTELASNYKHVKEADLIASSTFTNTEISAH